MERAKFIKKLRRELQWHLSATELRKTVQEYEGYFATAAANGSDEATAAAELGDPALVASEVLSECGVAIVEVRYNKIRTIVAFTILTISAFIYAVNPIMWQLIDVADDGTIISISMAFRIINLLVLLPTTLALLLGLGKRDRSGKGHTGLLFGANIVAVAIVWVLWYSLFYMPIISVLLNPDAPTIHWLWFYISPDALGPILAIKIKIFSIVIVAFFMAAGWRISHGQLIYIPLLYLNSATLLGLYEYVLILHQMSDLDALLPVMADVMLHMAIGVLISAAVAVLLLLRRRRVTV